MPSWSLNSLEAPRVFYLQESSVLADLGERISRLAANEFRAASAFAFLSTRKIPFESDAATPLLGYAAGKPAILLTPGAPYSIEVDLITASGLSQLNSEPAVSRVREADLLHLLQEHGYACTLEAQSNYHFVTPSLRHTPIFIRIGDLLRDLPTLDRLAFWLRPYVGQAKAILVDSWSIAAPVLRALQINSLNIPFDCLPEHPSHNSLACRRVLDGLLSRMKSGGKLIAFVSISGSGRMVSMISKMVEDLSAGTCVFECFSIYGFTSTPDSADCFARIPARDSFDQNSCELCAKGSSAVPIDPASYYLRSLHEKLVLLSKKHLDPSRPFLERYRNSKGVFVVHHDDSNDGRHHAFDINISELILHPEFASRFHHLLDRLAGCIDLLVHPNHSAGRRLAAIAIDVLRCDSLISDTLERGSMGCDDIRRVQTARRMLIIDDVLNSGSRLKRYIQSLREGRYKSLEAIDYLVAVCRPSSSQNREILAKSLTAGHGWKGAFHAVEEIILPNWNQENCPWCAEFDFISRVAKTFARPPKWLSNRLAKLRNRTRGIDGEPLLLLPGVSSVVLGDQSLVCPGGTSSMVTLFGIASALQHHRNDPDSKSQLHPGFPVGSVLKPMNVKDRYTEGLIRAALLRVVQRAEWGQVAGRETRDLLISELGNENQKVLAGELLFGLGRASLPPISASALRASFEGFLGDGYEALAAVIGAV